MEWVGRCDGGREERGSSWDGDYWVNVEITFSTLNSARGG